MIKSVFSDYPESVIKRFERFHSETPEIFEIFKKLSFKMLYAGRKKYSARTIFEVLRWNADLSGRKDPFKINNDFIPMYKRLLANQHREFEDFFEFREVKSKGIMSDEEKKRRGIFTLIEGGE